MTPPDAPIAMLLATLGALAAVPWWWTRQVRLPRRPDTGRSRSHAARRRRVAAGAAAGRVDDAVVLDLVRAALAAGRDVVGALEAVGGALPSGQGEAYERAARALRLGARWDAAWLQPDAVAQALAPAWADGVDPEPLLTHAAGAIRRGRQARAREAAARLGVRLVLPLGLCLLPAFVLLGLVPLLIAAGVDLWGG